MNVIDAINQRRAVKHYDSKFIVPEGDEKQILETAILAPSSFNIQHWRVVNVKDKAIRAQLCEAAWDQAQVKDA
ncbi:MAG: nitroreductase family protein, partial [Rickettsiales bacterium]|nr:nitroreductase family protein [Rickettsiales bacterium]